MKQLGKVIQVYILGKPAMKRIVSSRVCKGKK